MAITVAVKFLLVHLDCKFLHADKEAKIVIVVSQPASDAMSVIDGSENSLKGNVVAQEELCQNQHEECQQCQTLQNDNLRLLRHIDLSSISESAFVNDEKKVIYYTGLPNFGTLKLVTQFCHFRGS